MVRELITKVRAALLFILVLFLLAGVTPDSFSFGASENERLYWRGTETRYVDFDAGTDSFSEYVGYVTKNGVMNGYPDGSFRGGSGVTYGEFIKMMLAAIDLKYSGQVGSYFEKREIERRDVKKNWADPYYYDALEKGLMTEFEITHEMLDEYIPRKHMALLIKNSYKNSVYINYYDSIVKSIEDVDYGDDCEYEIIFCYSEGFLTGYEDGTFRPEQTMTRKEAAACLTRFLKKDNYETVMTDKKTGESLPITGDVYEGHTVYPIERFVSRDELNKHSVLNWQNYCYVDDDYPNKIGIKRYNEENPDVTTTENVLIEGAEEKLGFILKDGKVVDMSSYFPGLFYASTDLIDRDCDYIGLYRSGTDVVRLIPNPFKK